MIVSTTSIWGFRVMKKCTSDDYVNWAVGMLESGSDSKHLRILAGLESSTSLFETEDFFARSIKEIELFEPSREEAIRGYSVYVAGQIVRREVPAREGVKRLFQLCVACDYPGYLNNWYTLDDACHDIEYGNYPYYYPSLTKDNLQETVLGIARKFLEEQKN